MASTISSPPQRRCRHCDRAMLTHSDYRPRVPGALYAGARGLCSNCYKTELRRENGYWRRPPVPPMKWRWTLATADTEPDLVIVDRVIGGERIRMDPPEIREVIRRLTTAGRSAYQIAEQLGCTTRTVQRHRARQRAAQKQPVAA